MAIEANRKSAGRAVGFGWNANLALASSALALFAFAGLYSLLYLLRLGFSVAFTGGLGAVLYLTYCVASFPAGLRALRVVSTPMAHARAEDLLHFARTLFSQSVRRQDTRHLMHKADQNGAMGHLTSQLLTSLQESEILATLDECLPSLGSCRAAFFDPQSKEDLFGESVLTASRESPLRFASRAFPPQGLYPTEEPLNLAILPPRFRNERLGFAAVDAGNLDPLAMIVRQLSAAVKSARLHAEVRPTVRSEQE